MDIAIKAMPLIFASMKDSCNKKWVRGIMTVVRPFLGMKTYGAEHIDPSLGPSVFVANHGVTSGPVAALIYLPVHFRPWIHDRMLTPDEAADSMMETFKARYNCLGQKRKKRVIRHLAGYLSKAMEAFNPIPVSRSNPMNMMQTVQESVDTLKSGDNLLIFPENPDGRYDVDSFRKLHPAFGILAFQYYQKTGRLLAFYPCFSDMGNKTFSIGSPILYSPGDDVQDSIRQLVSKVQASLIELSQSNS